MKTILTYKDGQQVVFQGGDSLELDLDGLTVKEIFSIEVFSPDGKVVFSAYHWHNQPISS